MLLKKQTTTKKTLGNIIHGGSVHFLIYWLWKEN